MESLQYIKTGDRYLMDTYGRFPVVVERGENALFYDADGRRYIDFASGIGVNSLGSCDPEWSAAVARQAALLGHCSNYYYNIPNVKLAERLIGLSGMSRVFFGNSGAEANEGAIKTARKYSFDKYGKGRSTIISLNQSFHGRTVTTLEATGQEVFHNYFFPFTGGFKYADPNIEGIKALADDSVCAVILECIQGEGGVLPLDAGFVRELRALCNERDWLMIADEVQTGIGRTGKFLCCEHYGVLPDIVTLAKGLGGGLPIGAFMCADSCAHVMGRGMHGSTFGGNPIVAAGAITVLDRLESPGFLDEVTKKGEYIKAKITAMESPKVGQIRGMGLMVGIPLKGADPKELCARLFSMGLLTLTAGSDVLRLLPPLTIGYAELDEGLALIKKALEESGI